MAQLAFRRGIALATVACALAAAPALGQDSAHAHSPGQAHGSGHAKADTAAHTEVACHVDRNFTTEPERARARGHAHTNRLRRHRRRYEQRECEYQSPQSFHVCACVIVTRVSGRASEVVGPPMPPVVSCEF